MNIISKYKEYYDYIQSFYGIDKDIVLDRRKTWEDEYITDGYTHSFDSKDGCFYYVVEIGTNQYVIKVTYKPNENCNYNDNIYRPDNYPMLFDKVEVLQVFISEKQIIEHHKESKSDRWFYSKYYKKNKSDITTNSPTNIYYLSDNVYKYAKNGIATFDDIVHYSVRKNDDAYVRLDKVAGLIPAQEAYDAIYNFLIKKREPIVVDSRNDIQKIESAGFDKKTSFRKM